MVLIEGFHCIFYTTVYILLYFIQGCGEENLGIELCCEKSQNVFSEQLGCRHNARCHFKSHGGNLKFNVSKIESVKIKAIQRLVG